MQREVSLYDLMEFERSREAIINEDYQEFYSILHELGIDINREIDTQNCFHRPLTKGNKVFFGTRWVGVERTDKEWMESEWCTRENKIRVIGNKDFSFAKELVSMSKCTDFTQRAMDYLRTSCPYHEYGLQGLKYGEYNDY